MHNAATRFYAELWPHAAVVLRPPDAHVMACCLKSIKDKEVACVLLNSEGTPITMSVAKASDSRCFRRNLLTGDILSKKRNPSCDGLDAQDRI